MNKDELLEVWKRKYLKLLRNLTSEQVALVNGAEDAWNDYIQA